MVASSYECYYYKVIPTLMPNGVIKSLTVQYQLQSCLPQLIKYFPLLLSAMTPRGRGGSTLNMPLRLLGVIFL